MPTIAEGRRQWKFCLNSSTIRGQKLPLDQVVEIAAAAGYDAIEPWIDELEAYEAGGGDLSVLREKIHDLGLTVESAIGFFEWVVDDDARRHAGLERARADMERLKRLGGIRIAAPPFGAHEAGSPPLDLSAAAERYAALCDIGERAGVTPLCEVWGFSANLNTLAEGLFVAAQSGHPNACLLLDSYHLYKGGSPLEGLRFLQGEKLPLFHINDWPDIPREKIVDGDRIWPGDGVAPLIPLLRTLVEIGFSGYLSLELFHPDYWAMDPAEAARTGREKLQIVTEAAL
ncbi:MAG: sugar phosphate isomerase/epimerase family protein [Armatimonas sp.]